MVRTTVVNFADDMNGGIISIGRNVDHGYRLFWVLNGGFHRADFWLLPPMEGQTISVRIF